MTSILIFFALAPVVGAASEAGDTGSDVEITVPINTLVHAPPGSETILNTTTTPDDFVGSTCEVTATAENQVSVHPGNDLAVKSATEIVLENVEGVSGGVVTATDDLVLGSTIVITLVMGPDAVFSAGIMVTFDCGETGGTTLTTSTTSSTTTTTSGETATTSGETTTTVEVGGTVVTTTPATTGPSGQGTVTTLATEVLGTEVLPFTGPGDGVYALYGLALIAGGSLILIGVRSITGSRRP